MISREAIRAYADSDDLDFQALAKDLRAMDGAYLDWNSKQREIEREKREREAKLKEAKNVRRRGH